MTTDGRRHREFWADSPSRYGLSDAFASALDEALSVRDGAFPFPLSARPDALDARDYVYEPSLVELPAFKLPQARPGNSISDALVVRNQRGEGSCTGQALATVIDVQNIARRAQGADVPRHVSARMLYATAQIVDTFSDDDLPGSSIRAALKGFWNRGVCCETQMPYLPGLRNDALSVAVAHDARRVALGTYMRLRHVLNDYHCALVDTGAILVSAMVHEGWEPSKVARNKGIIKMARTPRLQGAHAFAIVGFTATGFLVLNSWGPSWGGFDVLGAVTRAVRKHVGKDGDAAVKALQLPDLGKGGLPGIALWPYEDWQRHVLDAWALRLAAPTYLPSGFAGGYRAPATANVSIPGSQRQRRSVRESEVLGHLVYFDGDRLPERRLFASPLATIRETARYLRHEKLSEKYAHLLIHVPGVFDTFDRVVARAAAYTPVLKRNGVYPIFLVRDSGATDILGGIVRGVMPHVIDRLGAEASGTSDRLIERLSAPVGSALWAAMKRQAGLTFAKNGETASAIQELIDAAGCGSLVRQRGIHLVARGGGAYMLGEMVSALLAGRAQDQLMTVSLLAPACTLDFLKARLTFDQHVDTTLYTLDRSQEKRPDPALGGYGKSPLWLVSQAWEEAPRALLAGITEHHPQAGLGVNVVTAAANSPACRATYHGHFDSDPFTMNHILGRIVGGQALRRGKGGFRPTEIAAEEIG